MTDDWRPLLIPHLPANDERATGAKSAQVEKAERDALAMMERAKATLAQTPAVNRPMLVPLERPG